MALSDPLVVDVATVATNFPRISVSPSGSTYRSTDGTLDLVISRRTAKRNRVEIRLNSTKIEPDLLMPATNKPYAASAYLVVDSPLFGYSEVELKALVDVLNDLITQSSGAQLTKILSGQS